MAKAKSIFVCQNCGQDYPKWSGKCLNCGEWNTMVERTFEKDSGSKKTAKAGKTFSISDIKTKDTKRVKTRIDELDRVLGGGLVPGQVVLIAGEPGIGKSTILLQTAGYLGNVLYASGEESVGQIRLRADRLKVKSKDIQLVEETDADVILQTARQLLKTSKLDLLIIDSIQTMTTGDLSGMAGSVGQVREIAHRLVRFAKKNKVPVFIVGHVTKQGSVAGPAVLAHIVDSVLWFEGENTATFRLIRAIKNRFGATDEVGIFSMGDTGLISVKNPGEVFLSKNKDAPGVATTSVLQGTRPMLVEVQALTVKTNLAFPRRVSLGIDNKRLELLIAVLTKYCGLNLNNHDVYVNIAGGLKIQEPSVDFAVCMAIASSFFEKPLKNKSIVFGEVGLLGDIREVSQQKRRMSESKRLGYSYTINSIKYKYLRDAIKKELIKK